MTAALDTLLADIRSCRICAAALALGPRPIVQAASTARLLIIGQAPGTSVHASGVPWDDPSGERLCDWTGLQASELHDPARIALMPMGFCYPGKGPSADLPPRPECAPLWHARLRALLPEVRLTLLVGHHALRNYLPAALRPTMTDAVRRFAEAHDGLFPLPHPSWRSTVWMRRNPWFAAEVLPALRRQIATALA
ncbi:MAG: uracil-DNA glycosylase family protein [Sphingomonadales bacterium]|jgi:uracil-DNA glycosylase